MNLEAFDQFFNLFLNPATDLAIFSVLLKMMFLVGFGIYILFAAMVVKQIFMMTKTIKTPLEPFLKMFGVFYLVLSIIVFLFVAII